MKKFIVCLLVLAGCSAALHVDVKEQIVLEYGAVPKLENFTDQKDVSVKEVKRFDGKKLGEQNIIVVFVNADGKESSEEITVTVKDTKLPEIVLHKDTVEITEGDAFDGKANVSSVKDPVDGELPFSDKKDVNKNGYMLSGNVDVHKPGEYKVSVIAFDKNGNKAKKEFSVKVKEKKKETVKEPVSGGTKSSNNSQSTVKQNTPADTPVSQPQETETTQQCVSNGQFGAVGNSGKVFYSKQEMYDWAESVIFDENSPYYMMRYDCWTVYDNCGERNDVWTVNFKE